MLILIQVLGFFHGAFGLLLRAVEHLSNPPIGEKELFRYSNLTSMWVVEPSFDEIHPGSSWDVLNPDIGCAHKVLFITSHVCDGDWVFYILWVPVRGIQGGVENSMSCSFKNRQSGRRKHSYLVARPVLLPVLL